MKTIRKIKVITLLFLLLLLIYTLLRTWFYLLYFHGHGKVPALAAIFALGVSMDFTALFYVNLLFLLFYFFVFDWLPERIGSKIALSLFLLLNIPFLAINFIDLGYFKFTNRRITRDFLLVMNDSLGALPAFFKNYWYLFLSFALVVVCLFFAAKRILYRTTVVAEQAWYVKYPLALLIIIVLSGLARGVGGRPVLPTTPLLYFDAEYQPLAANSTLSFLYSIAKRHRELDVLNFYSEKELDSIFTIKRVYHHKEPFQRKNVVIFIMESFCREYLENGSPYRAKTPFLDSLISQSTWCSNAFSNGTISNQGIVSILASMPPVLDGPYFYSIYSNNKIRALGTILKEEGYSTHFFMGAGPDHFGFGKFCRMAGIDHYVSREDFNDDRYYDGSWGIYDHRFLPFGAGMLQKQAKPFLAVFFNLNSHYPFAIPPELRNRFNFPGQQPSQKSAAYVDYSLQLFFNEAKHSDWYRNTIFVFSADHSLLSYGRNDFNAYTAFRIPIFIFDPSAPEYHEIKKTVQQTDIVPTILDKLAYSGAFMSFGRSIYDSTAENYAINRFRGVIQAADTGFLLGYNPETKQPAYLYRTTGDSSVKTNLVKDPAYEAIKSRLLRFDKAVLQRYNNSIIHNNIFVR